MQLAKREEDVLLHRGGLRVCTACSMLSAFEKIAASESTLAQPLLATHGEKDNVCSLAMVRRLMANCASTDKELKVYPDGLHDLLHDYEKADVRSDILEWMAAHL